MADERIRRTEKESKSRMQSQKKSRGVVACFHCGSENPDTFMFCASCGVKISRLCPYCKETHSVFVTVCPHTGEPVPQEVPRKKRNLKKALAASLGALAIAGSVLLSNMELNKETTYSYMTGPTHYAYRTYVKKPSPRPPAVPVIRRECPEVPNCCCYGIPPREKYPQIIKYAPDVER